MVKYKYCPVCGSELNKKEIDGRERSYCKTCSWVHYKNPLPATAALVVNDRDEILLIKRKKEPYKNAWALPGGFIEIDETLENGALRELKEETNISGIVKKKVDVVLHDSDMYGAVLIIGFEICPIDHDVVPGDDAIDAKYFSKNKMPEIPIKTHRQLLSAFLN
ncbi:MAG: NUDIX hydrolase [Candidatus Omnitrophica bacterium]|nr:NUDIX hydrolase [Candidatus Omnitrophota bacterium]